MDLLFESIKILANPQAFVGILSGFLVGLFFGAVPGLTATLAIALLLPMTFGLPKHIALAMSAAIFMGGMYGGSITAILINIPGAPANAITAIEGHPLTKKGAAPKALRIAAFCSSVGGMLSVFLTFFLLRPLNNLFLSFRTEDKAVLIIFALIVSALLESRAITKGILATLFGIMLATVGIDFFFFIPRFTFGISALTRGMDLLTIVVGAFCIAEILSILTQPISTIDLRAVRQELKRHRWKEFLFTFQDLREVGFITILRSVIAGWVVGVLPGGGGAMASLINYSLAKAFSRRKHEYGQGSAEGLGAAETGNNAMCAGAVVPMILFGIPGDSVTAVILGVLLIHGLIPGPYLLIEQKSMVGAIYGGLLFAAILIYIAFLLFARQYVWLCSIRKGVLYPFIALAALIGLYGATYSYFQLLIATFIGLVIWFLRSQGYPTVPFLMGFILGPLLEKFFRTALSIKGSYTVFVSSPICLALWTLTVVSIFVFGLWVPKIIRKTK